MIKIVMGVRDTRTEIYINHFTVRHTGEALRDFRLQVNTEGNVLSAHPEDFELWQLALWDDETGTFYLNDEKAIVKQRLARATDLKDNNEN